ncbi:MAG: phosphate signaling complex protein PhoU [Planctomycetaceae bacterium]
MSIHLKNDLDTLHHDILSMCGEVEEMVHQAVDSLSDPDFDKAAVLAEKDDEIDRWDVRIEESCLKTLALHQPVAIDLRRIATVMKFSSELERVADLAVHIAERACGLIGVAEIVIPDRLKQMAQIAVDMLHRSIAAYVQLNSALAREVCGDDDTVDALNRDVIAELTRVMGRSPDHVEPALHLFSASRHIERVADHATNIAEDVVYLVEGEIIRHRAHLERTRSAAKT